MSLLQKRWPSPHEFECFLEAIWFSFSKLKDNCSSSCRASLLQLAPVNPDEATPMP